MGRTKKLADDTIEEDDVLAPPTLAISTPELPFETKELRLQLKAFYDHQWEEPCTGLSKKVGNYQWGVYAFYDYENEPIYVGQTNESLRQRIGRHLTNQRTDAVAMSVLDPFEVCYIEVWPLPDLEGIPGKDKSAKVKLNALEYCVYQKLLQDSVFSAVLNEVEPTKPDEPVELPTSYKAKVVSESVSNLRDHPDLRIARRAATLAKLAQVICERKVQPGLRKVLLTQARRLEWLANERYGRIGNVAVSEDED